MGAGGSVRRWLALPRVYRWKRHRRFQRQHLDGKRMPDTDRSAAFAKTLRAIFLGIALLALSVACVGYLLLIEIRRPAGNDASPVEFIVEPGDSASVIATRLGAAGLIRQPLLFTILVRFQGLDSKLQAGRYLLRADMTMSEIIAALQNSRVEEVQVTIIEGSRLEEIAEQLAAAGLVNVTEQAFLRAARNGAAFQAQHFYLKQPAAWRKPGGISVSRYLPFRRDCDRYRSDRNYA